MRLYVDTLIPNSSSFSLYVLYDYFKIEYLDAMLIVQMLFFFSN